jgi:hypothetical protein
MIVKRYIAQCHAALFVLIPPFKNIIVQQGLVNKTSILATHNDNRGHFNNCVGLYGPFCENASAHSFGITNIYSVRNKIDRLQSGSFYAI